MTSRVKNTKWRIHQIDKDICQYIFNDNDGTPNYDINITVLLNNDKALLIDTSFMHHATEIKSDLQTKGITVDKIVLSHYHPIMLQVPVTLVMLNSCVANTSKIIIRTAMIIGTKTMTIDNRLL